MNLVILDGHALNPGDLSWQPLAQLGALTYYDRTEPEQVLARAADADVLFTNKVVLDAGVLAALPRLKYIGLLSTGYNVVDVQAARAAGIPVCNVPAYSTDSVAQLTFALLLEAANGVGEHAGSVARGDWAAHPDFCYWLRPLSELSGKSIGIVGFGSIGRAVARIATAFGMRVYASGRRAFDAPQDVVACDTETLLRSCDVVSLHCPLTPDNAGMIDADAVSKMRDGAILINTARGGLIDERAVLQGLERGKLSWYLADVLTQEPPAADTPLLRHPRCIVTPHIAWASRAARERLLDIAADNLRTWQNGGLIHCVWQK